MDKLVHKLNEEMKCWVGDLVTNSDLPDVELLSRHSYEYCIKKEIIDYFDGRDDISDDFIVVLMGKESTLEYLYGEYMKDDTVNIQNEIENLISNIIFKLKYHEK